MGVLYRTNPKNPIEFLASWLRNHGEVKTEAKKQIQNEQSAI